MKQHKINCTHHMLALYKFQNCFIFTYLYYIGLKFGGSKKHKLGSTEYMYKNSIYKQGSYLFGACNAVVKPSGGEDYGERL